MSYTSWHTCGYGVCLSRLECDSIERMQKLLELAEGTTYRKTRRG